MATHVHKGATMVYRWRFGPQTPAWLDRAESPLAYRIGRRVNLLGLTRREYIPAE